MSTLTIGTHVRVKDAYLNGSLSRPVRGTIMDTFRRPDWGGAMAFVVMFDHDEPGFPPGGEFTADRLEPVESIRLRAHNAAKAAEGGTR